MKIGVEVEGRMKGVKTFFISGLEIDKFMSRHDELNEKYPKYKNVYIAHDVDMLDPRLDLMATNYDITIETSDRITDIPSWISHVIYLIEDDNFWKLRETDSVKFHQGHNAFVKAISVENMFHTNPEDFAGDREI